MKVSMKVAAAFMAPLIGFCWIYELSRMAVYLWEWPLTTANLVAATVTAMQILFVFFAFDAGFIKKNPGEKE
jgi:hypothetical protein